MINKIMKENKIIITIIFLLKFFLIQSTYILTDKLFKQIDIQSPICYKQESNFDNYKGVITNIEDIIGDDISPEVKLNQKKIESTKYGKYPFVYLPNKEHLFKYIDFFPEKTLFFTDFLVDYNKLKKDICYIRIDDFSTFKYYYLIIAESKLSYLLFPILLCIFYINGVFINRYDKNNRNLIYYRTIYFYSFAQRISLYSIGIAISSITIYYFLPSYIIYSLYKSYVVIDLMLILEGLSIIHFNDYKENLKKYFLIFFVFDVTVSVISEYIIYFIPFLDNFYLLHLKSIIEHVAFLVVIFIFFKTKFIHLYKQYLLEKRLGTILSVSYKFKTTIYLKIMIFSIIYCSSFIIMPFIEKIYIKIDNIVENFYLDYFITICMELFFSIVISLILSPPDPTLFLFLPIIIDYNRFKFEAKIKEEQNDALNISNVTQNLLKDEYQGKLYPIILINPFGKTNNVFSDLHVGKIKKPKIKKK
jgi:hypothetical protein